MVEIEKELARATGQIAIDTATDARRALGAIFGDAAAELANVISDNVKLWRFKNLMRISDEVRLIAQERGLSSDQLKALPLGEALRVANAASDEDKPEVQVLWARLIANSVSNGGAIERAFIDLLKSISPNEVALLDLVWQVGLVPRKIGMAHFHSQLAEISRTNSAVAWAGLSWEARNVALQNLQRLRCISPPPPRQDPFLLQSTYLDDGVRSRRVELLDARKVKQQFADMTTYLREAVGGVGAPREGSPLPQVPEWQTFHLTPLGAALMRACCGTPDIKAAR